MSFKGLGNPVTRERILKGFDMLGTPKLCFLIQIFHINVTKILFFNLHCEC